MAEGLIEVNKRNLRFIDTWGRLYLKVQLLTMDNEFFESDQHGISWVAEVV